MPKLSKSVIQEKKSKIEEAASDLFIKQGFHATSIREIAKRANVSLGNLYNYYPTKEAIFESIINSYQGLIDDKLREMLESLDEPLEPVNLKKMGVMVGELVDEHSDFWLLMYVDVLEFRNRHFRKMFDRLSERFGKHFATEFEEAQKRGDLRLGVDPATAFTVAYMQFFNYFLVENLFGGNRHLGLDNEQALNCLTKIFVYGMLSEDKLAEFKRTANKVIGF